MIRAGRISLTIDHGKTHKLAVDEAYRLVADNTRMTYNRANILTPVDTGNLRVHNKMNVRRTANGARGEVYNDADYAAAVHDGSGPYTIRPKKRKALKFEIGGRTVYAKSVRHPGVPGRPWLARAGREVAARTGFVWTVG